MNRLKEVLQLPFKIQTTAPNYYRVYQMLINKFKHLYYYTYIIIDIPYFKKWWSLCLLYVE